ncbi:MAG: hypothetical protein FWF54_05195 [Candidatus Azobacteroides sp.]|nr:hypothetical protein [Candidatus Azobacteroides sp.]
MTTQELKTILLAEHQRDVKLMWIGYAVIAGAVLIVLGLIVWLFVKLQVSFSPGNMAEELTTGMPVYVKIIFPLACLIAVGYAYRSFRNLQKRPETIDEFIKYIENGKRVISINDSKIYRIKIPLYFVNYHTGPVQMFGVTLEGVNKQFILPVPFQYTDQVKDLLNENS